MLNTKSNSRFHLLSLLKFALGWPLSILALFFVARIILSQQKDIVYSIEQPNVILLFPGLFSLFLFYLIRSFIWKFILKELGYDIPLKTASYLWEIAELRRFVPGKLWTFLSRATLFSKINVPTKVTIRALIIETESFLLAAFIISILGAFFYSNSILPHVVYSFLIPLFFILVLATVLFIDGSLLTKYIKGRFLSKITLILPEFSPYKNATILLASIFYLFLFGFGTYLAVASITFVSPEFFLEISVFFIFALLVGYLSFITPMGLGVRESIMIVGLSQFVTLSTAGVASIFARIVLIVSELLFLLFTYFWKKTKSKFLTNLENFIALHKQEIILGFFITIYFVYFISTSWLRYDNFYTGRFDLGNMDQTVWNTLQGRIFQTNGENGEIISRLGFHADFILILLSPFYLIWTHAKMLLLIQTTVLGLGAIFVYALGKNIVKDKNLSAVFAFLFLLNPAVQFTNLYDFHAVTLATTFLLGTFYFLYRKRYLLFLLFALLAALTKEQVWVITAIFGLYIFFSSVFKGPSKNVIASPSADGRGDPPLDQRLLRPPRQTRGPRNDKEKLLGIIVFLVSLAIFYLLIWHAIPNAKGSQHFAISYYSDFGESPTNIVKSVFLSPQKTLTTFFQKDQLSYLSQLLLPLGFLSLLSPLHLIFALPDLFINLLSGNSKLHQIYYQYSAAITPFIFISAIFGVRNLKVWFPKIPHALLTTYCLLLTAYSAYSFGPLPFAKEPNIDMFTKPQKNKVDIENFISNIPAHYSVAATNNAGSHLSQRQKIFTIPNGIDKADFVIFLIDKDTKESFESEIKMIGSDKNYKEVFRTEESFMVFEKQSAL